MKKLLSMILVLVMVFSSVVPALSAEAVTETAAADFPLGASNRTINIDGTDYLINDIYTTDGWRNGNVRGTIPNYVWDPAFETYTFDPDAIEGGVTFDPKYGFPLRASYRTPTDCFGEMNYLAQTYPDLVKLTKFGDTVGISSSITGGSAAGADPSHSSPLYMMEISNAPGVNDGRPTALHMGVNHGGELPSIEMAMNLAWYLLANYGKPGYEDVTNLLETTKILILPMTNQDGVIASMRATGGRRQNANGVDPNRNWPYGWGSNNGSSGTARGVGPNSEPEIAAVTKVYESNQVVASISGHTSGQIVIYAWGHQTSNYVSGNTVEGTVGIPLLHKLAAEMTALNMHHEQPSEGLYPASGDLCDYTWGLARALHFTVEYGTVQAPAYMGQNRYMVYTNYNDANGNTRKIPITYSTNANSSQPAADLTAPVAYVDNPKYYIGGYGSSEKQATLAEVQALGNITGKILITPQGISTTETANIIAAAQDQGAVGVLISTAGSAAHANNSTGATFYSPGNVNAAITIPVAGTSKPYTREIYNKAKAGENVTVTFKSTQDAFVESQYWQWERHLESYMKNMSFATEYASHIKGSITDGKGQPLDNATLNLSMIADGLIKHPGTYSGSGDNLNGYGDNPMPVGTYETEHTSTYDVKGGTYDWSVVPSQQPDPQLPSTLDPTTHEENHVNKPDYAPKDQIKDKDGNLTGDRYLQLPDRGYDITASANGRYSDTKNVKVGDYQLTIDNVNFDLPVAIASDFTFNPSWDVRSDITVPFSIYRSNGEPIDNLPNVANGSVRALVNGQDVPVTNLGGGNYSATFNLKALGITSVAGATLEISFFSETESREYSPLVIGAAVNQDGFTLTSEDAVQAGESIVVNAAFDSAVDANTGILTYTFDKDVFSCTGFTPAAGVTVVDEVIDNNTGTVKITVMKPDYAITSFGDIMLQAKDTAGFSEVVVNVSYVVKGEDDSKVIASATASKAIKVIPVYELGDFTLIDLSDIIDVYGTYNDEWDFNGDGYVDLYDVTYVAVRII